MTLPDQTRAMAELDGFHTIQPNPLYPDRLAGFRGTDTTALLGTPDYSTRDAVIRVIEKQPKEVKVDIAVELVHLADHQFNHPTAATLLKLATLSAAELREALLRACGKWRE